MILPDKYISIEETMLGLGAVAYRKLETPQTVTNLWRFMMRVPQVATYERFLLSLDLLYALGMIEMHEGTIRRT